MDNLVLALWMVGIASLSLSLFWQPDPNSGNEVLARRVAMLGFLYLALATLLSVWP